MGFYIPAATRSRLLKYKYSSTDKSLTSKYILNPYWSWLVTLFPKSMAPNAITLLGLFCVFVNFSTLLYYNPTLACGPKPLHVSKGGPWSPMFTPPVSDVGTFSGWASWFGFATSSEYDQCAPRWLYFTFAVGLFVYQSLDAIDGKQARRTGTSGPLGELFDHGCDALNTTLEVILTASALNLGLCWWTVASLVATNANFYLTTWEEYHTGNLYLSAFSGPVEGILLIIVVFTITGFTGPSFWDQGILSVTHLNSLPIISHFKDLPMNDLFLIMSTIGLFFNILSSTHNVYLSLPPASRKLSSLISPLSRLSPWLIHTTAMVIWLSTAPDILHSTLLIPFVLFWGLSFAHHVGLLILAHLTASPFPSVWKHPLLILSVLGAVDSHLEDLTGVKGVQRGEGSHRVVVAICLVVALGVYAHFVWEVVGDICEFYDINCLTIKDKSSATKPNGSLGSKAASDRILEKGKRDWGVRKD